ncbi:CaiB/BaiF CoA transferase family protein [Streptomyces sp. NPDC059349]|uniref:CaiB/BaiF CoA transferase family protein n=1 Tax=Streptomyces sp. NPDC059349 TaxID=3346808 RepID=UPI00368C9E8B
MDKPEHSAAAEGPLSGIRVVEIASMYTGPMAAQYLGDMGADVIKVEEPKGDLTRSMGPSKTDGMGAFFLTCNRNKRSVVLDLKRPEARHALRRIILTADIVITSVRAASAERIGISYEQVKEYAPAIIYCHGVGYSEKGPYAGRPAYDDVIQAVSGLASMQTVLAGQPRYVPSILGDKIAGMHLAYAAVLALVHRLRTGEGQQVSVPMFETLAAFNLVEHLWGHSFEPPLAPMGYVPVSQAARHPYATTDGFVAVLPYSDAQWRRFFQLAGESELIDDPRLTTFKARQQNIHYSWDVVEHLVATKSTQEWLDILAAEDIPYAPVNTLEDLVHDPHLEKVGFWTRMTDGTGEPLLTPNNPLSLPASPPAIRRGPPQLGQHTTEVLAECRATATGHRAIADSADQSIAVRTSTR